MGIGASRLKSSTSIKVLILPHSTFLLTTAGYKRKWKLLTREMQRFCSCGKWSSLFSTDKTESLVLYHYIFINVNQIKLMFQYKRSEGEAEKKTEILKQITETVKHRNHLDGSVELIGTLLFGPAKGSSVLNSVRASGLPLVGDWKCLKSMVNIISLCL